METIKDNAGREYKKIGGTFFHMETPDELARIIDGLIESRRETRVRIFQGDTATGREWGEENNVTGYIGRSTGSIKIPLLINNRRSLDGPALSDNSILKIQTTSGRVLWQADNYVPPAWWSGLLSKPIKENGKTYITGVWRREKHQAESEKVLYSRHITIESAARLADFMRGARGNK
jgi:hypothetical protein